MEEVKLGDKVRDKVSGFSGVVVARHEYLNGCARMSVQPPVDKDGKLPDTATFDHPQLELIKPDVAEKDSGTTGGPEKYADEAR